MGSQFSKPKSPFKTDAPTNSFTLTVSGEPVSPERSQTFTVKQKRRLKKILEFVTLKPHIWFIVPITCSLIVFRPLRESNIGKKYFNYVPGFGWYLIIGVCIMEGLLWAFRKPIQQFSGREIGWKEKSAGDSIILGVATLLSEPETSIEGYFTQILLCLMVFGFCYIIRGKTDYGIINFSIRPPTLTAFRMKPRNPRWWITFVVTILISAFRNYMDAKINQDKKKKLLLEEKNDSKMRGMELVTAERIKRETEMLQVPKRTKEDFKSKLLESDQKIKRDEARIHKISTVEKLVAKYEGGKKLGIGLKNASRDNNCCLNVIIQSLWHIRQFREEWLKSPRSDHHHSEDPCVTCALHDVFTALKLASADSQSEVIDPKVLRTALSRKVIDNRYLKEGEMIDASEVLSVILSCLHQSHTSDDLEVSSTESNGGGAWECGSKACKAHSFFGMNFSEKIDCGCGVVSRKSKYTSFHLPINATELRKRKAASEESTFLELVKLGAMHTVSCDVDIGGCGKLHHIIPTLLTPPHAFTIVVGWQTQDESDENIAATMAAISLEININGQQDNTHGLVSMVCYSGFHLVCFAYNEESDRWILFDDARIQDIGGWDKVLSICERKHYQPQILFFEAVNRGLDTISVMKAGKLRFSKPNNYWVESSKKRYVPRVEDTILGIVVDSKPDNFLLDIKGPSLGFLSVLAFEGGTRRNIPKFEVGTLIYVRVVKANNGMNPELSCTDATGKALKFGVLKDGYMVETSTGLARMLLSSPTCPVLEALGKKLSFETAIGLNGRVWVNAVSPSTVTLVAQAILKSESLSGVQQEIMVENLLQRIQ